MSAISITFLPPSEKGEGYDNVFLTETGIRLMDVAISALCSHVGDTLFERSIIEEMKELQEFRFYFL